MATAANGRIKRLLRTPGLFIGMALGCCLGVGGVPGNTEGGEAGIQRLGADQLAELEDRLQKLNGQLAPAVVRIVNPKKQGSFSGVIVSPSGEILTCAHHGLPPKTKVMVELADGRKVAATVMGSVKLKTDARTSYYAADAGLVVLGEQGQWPTAKLGRSADCKAGALCVALGYPHVYKPGQPPLLRLGRHLAPHAAGLIRTTCRIHPGDSGGPLFDLDGRVVGVHTAMESLKSGINWHSPVENFLAARDRLRGGEDVELAKDHSAMPEPGTERGGAWEPADGLRLTLSAAGDSTVEVVGDGKVVALGLVVDKDGWVLTKRTELMGPGGMRQLACRLTDGSKLEAQLMAVSRANDLALLKLPATDLAVVRWAKPGELRVGQPIASPGPDSHRLHCSVIGAVRAKNPGSKGDLPIRTRAAPEGGSGVVFAEYLPKRLEIDEARDLLKSGDVITHLDDVPTPTPQEFARARKERTEALDAVVGEWIKLTVRRAGDLRHVYLPLVGPAVPLPIPWQQARWNVRRDGFPNVFVHDGAIAHDRCGGPVVDRSGQVIGINIARADPIQTYAIPSDVAREAIAAMTAQAQKQR